MIMRLLNFILPSQASSTITLDGSIIIVLGAIILGYYIIKYKTSIFEVSPQLNGMENIENENKLRNINSENMENTENTLNQTTLQMNDKNKNKNMEEYVKNNEKEVIFNRR